LPKTLYMLASSSSTRCFIFFDGGSGGKSRLSAKSR
jgi:hypothetical protein